MDGRTKAARLAKAMRRDLIEHVGGKPTITQRILIDQACSLRLRIALMEADEAEHADPGRWTERRQVQFLAWTNSLTRLIRDIGIEAPTKASKASNDPWPSLPAE